MTDNLTPTDRKRTMRAVKRKGTSIERTLWATLAGLRISGWHKNVKGLLGNPDVVFYDRKIIIFVDGCFWHGHNCRNLTPSDNAEYWNKKIKRNQTRDEYVSEELTRAGWKVLRIWGCELKKGKIKELLALLSVLVI